MRSQTGGGTAWESLKVSNLGAVDGYLGVSDAPMQSDLSIVLEGGCLCTNLRDKRTCSSGRIAYTDNLLAVHLQLPEYCVIAWEKK